jgi:surface protein
MFGGATAFNQDISNWNISNVLNMSAMFYQATSFNQNISSWNTSNVTNMYGMFYQATSFDQNLGNWNISKVTDMEYMFTDVTLSTANYDAMLDKWSKQSVQPNVTFSGGNSKYCDVGEAGRNILTNATNNWTITDGGKNCSTLSVSKNTVSAWTLYPNPTQDRIEISGNTPVLNVQLFSITGKKMLTKDNTNSLSLKAVPKGMYLMKIRGENGTYTHKVIKQ